MIITENQKKELELLIPEHGEALVAFGADMFRRGIFTGAVGLALGVALGIGWDAVFHGLKKKNYISIANSDRKNKNEIES